MPPRYTGAAPSRSLMQRLWPNINATDGLITRTRLSGPAGHAQELRTGQHRQIKRLAVSLPATHCATDQAMLATVFGKSLEGLWDAVDAAEDILFHHMPWPLEFPQSQQYRELFKIFASKTLANLTVPFLIFKASPTFFEDHHLNIIVFPPQWRKIL
jgi:hypothetical protein